MEFGQVHHIEYYVKDLTISNIFWDWFMKELNYKKISQWDDGVSWEHSTGTYICFVQVESQNLAIENDRQGSGLNHLAFQGASINQLDEMQKKLESKNIKVLKRNEGYLCFEDPNQFAVEIYAAESN